MSSYQYRELSRNEIRIIALQPGSDDSVVEVEIVHVFLDGNASYEALSYVWGDPTVTQVLHILDKAQQGDSDSSAKSQVSLSKSTIDNLGDPRIDDKFPPRADPNSTADCGVHIFKATTNLESVLRRLRSADKPRRLWADAICINQNDNVERGHQVAMMDKIYRNSTRVLAWLGGAADDSDYAMELIESFAEPSYLGNTWTWFRDIFMLVLAFITLHPINRSIPGFKCKSFGSREWTAINAIRSRLYWGRVWMIQELAVSKKDPLVGCGHKWVPFSAFRTLESVTSVDFYKPNQRWNRAFDAYTNPLVEQIRIRDEFRKSGKMDLQGLILRTHTFQASNQLDKLYALLGLVDNKHRKALEVNYNIKNAELCTQLTKHLIQDENDLQILSRVIDPLLPRIEHDGEAPTWVPKLYRRLLHGQSWSWRGQSRTYLASEGSKPLACFSEAKPSTLYIKGMVIDEIEESFGDWPYWTDIQNLDPLLPLGNITFRALRRYAKTEHWPSPDSTSELPDSTPSRLCTTLIKAAHQFLKNRDSGSSPFPDGPMTEQLLCKFVIREDLLIYTKFARRFHALTGIHLRQLEYSHTDLLEATTPAILRFLRNVLVKRCFFSTRKGYIGVGPADAQAGDHVCIFFGGKTCHVVRKTLGETSDSVSQLYLGDAYLHGFMAGESMRLLSKGVLQETEFALG